MGRVLLAKDLLQAEEAIALKILLPEYRHSIAGFLAEYVTQRSFQHPNIPMVHDLGFASHPRGGEVPYFTLEYCRGMPLIVAIPRIRKLRQAYPWMAQLLRALDYVHRMGWLHRDLKPGNVLVQMDDDSETSTHLIDLGVASRIGAPPEDVFIGTPEYCAPEMLAGYPFDQRSDLYSFGLVLYETIERRRPWPGSDEQMLLDNRLDTDPPRIRNAECPEALKKLVYDLLKPSARDRPTTAAEVLQLFCAATGYSTPLETEQCFLRHLRAKPFPGRETVLSAGDRCLTWMKAGSTVIGDRPRVMIALSRGGYDGGWLVHELADRAAVNGSRVVRVNLDRQHPESLSALQPALQVFRRLREDQGQLSHGNKLYDLPGAAAMLTRLHGPTVIVIEHLQRADRHSLEALRAAFGGSRNENLRVLATLDPDEAPVSPPSCEALLAEEYTQSHELEELSIEHAADWVETAIGRGVVGVPFISHLQGVAKGSPAGLVAGLHDLFRRGYIERRLNSYALKGSPPKAATPAHDANHAERLISALRHPLPENVVDRYLEEDASHVPAFIASGTLIQSANGWVQIGNQQWRDAVYRSIPAADKMHLHRRLARAIHAEDEFPNQRSLVAVELMHSDRPVLAAPHLVVAASEIVGVDTSGRAGEYLDRAQELLERHVTGENEGDVWRWWVMLWKARVRQAMAEGNFDALDAAAEALVELATEAAHIPSLAFALETKMVAAYEKRAWTALVRHAESRVALGGARPEPDALGLRHWAEGLRLRAFGEAAAAMDQWAEGLAVGPTRPRVAVLLRLHSARASLLTELGWVREAGPAVDAFEHSAESAGDASELIRARIMAAALQRAAGRPEVALLALRDIAKEMPPEHLRRASSALELELARSHLEFGWSESARDHARQAAALARRDHDPALEAEAKLAEAESWRLDRQGDGAKAIAQSVLLSMRDVGEWTPMAEARLLLVQLRADEVGPSDALTHEANGIAEQAERRQAHALAARAYAVAAEVTPDAGMALTLAEKAVAESERKSGWSERTWHLLRVLASARRRARRQQAAEALELRALEQLRRVAGTIGDEERRRSWLSTPDAMAVLGLAGVVAATAPDAPSPDQAEDPAPQDTDDDAEG